MAQNFLSLRMKLNEEKPSFFWPKMKKRAQWDSCLTCLFWKKNWIGNYKEYIWYRKIRLYDIDRKAKYSSFAILCKFNYTKKFGKFCSIINEKFRSQNWSFWKKYWSILQSYVKKILSFLNFFQIQHQSQIHSFFIFNIFYFNLKVNCLVHVSAWTRNCHW